MHPSQTIAISSHATNARDVSSQRAPGSQDPFGREELEIHDNPAVAFKDLISLLAIDSTNPHSPIDSVPDGGDSGADGGPSTQDPSNVPTAGYGQVESPGISTNLTSGVSKDGFNETFPAAHPLGQGVWELGKNSPAEVLTNSQMIGTGVLAQPNASAVEPISAKLTPDASGINLAMPSAASHAGSMDPAMSTVSASAETPIYAEHADPDVGLTSFDAGHPNRISNSEISAGLEQSDLNSEATLAKSDVVTISESVTASTSLNRALNATSEMEASTPHSVNAEVSQPTDISKSNSQEAHLSADPEESVELRDIETGGDGETGDSQDLSQDSSSQYADKSSNRERVSVAFSENVASIDATKVPFIGESFDGLIHAPSAEVATGTMADGVGDAPVLPVAGTPSGEAVSWQSSTVTIDPTRSLSQQLTQAVIEQSVRSPGDKSIRIEFAIDPPDFGKASIEIVQSVDGLRGRIVVADPMSYALLESELPSLVESLQDAGVNFSEFDLAGQSDNSGESVPRADTIPRLSEDHLTAVDSTPQWSSHSGTVDIRV